jgi:hypothetical protein
VTVFAAVTAEPPLTFLYRHRVRAGDSDRASTFSHRGRVSMSKLAVRSVAAAFATALVLSTAAPAFATPQPPTNGGNGAGQSGQCTGPADERPASCKSP